ncbi:MAG: 23S rRNA (uracil(1939)-C(5))-methyltransferase RlmD [Dehalococcoidia bacterium]|nr:23S rRNA (uracil(1939)-C(5))-methyltransferase RlmD [Dehalococcoidia bacterium]
MVVSPTQQGAGRLLRLRLAGMGRLGEALAETDGKPIFVFGGIPGEEVVAEVVRERRSHIAARVVEVVEASAHRVEAPCRYFGECVGCQWQHVAYERQLELKREVVCDTLERVGGLSGVRVEPTLASPQRLGYRNHARFTVSRRAGAGAGRGEGRLGFVNRETRRHVDVEECLLMAPRINEMLAALQGRAGETTQLTIRTGVNTGSWMLQPLLQDPDVPHESGQTHYEERLGGRAFRIASPSFFQVNTAQAERLVGLVREGLALTGKETLVDAYAGVGVFAALLAGDAARVVAIEDSAAAVEDAKGNAEGIRNVEFRLGKAEEALALLAAETAIDAVVLDPPRSGCQPDALRALIEAAPRRVVYVSCDPETLARDLRALTDGGFRIGRVQPVDMFPQTRHVECVTTLTLDGSRRADRRASVSRLVLASASPRRRDIARRALGSGVEFASAFVDERVVAAECVEQGGDALAVAQELALAKARAAADGEAAGRFIGADTVVEAPSAEADGEGSRVLGKPADAEEAVEMLRALRGREHRVITALAVVDAATGREEAAHCVSRVAMREYGDVEIAAYVKSGTPFDKAGAYGVQDEEFAPAAAVRGCYLNVVGLPVCALFDLLERFGARPAPDAPVKGWPSLMRCPACAKQARRASGA